MSQNKEKQRRRERREIQAALAEQLRLLAKRCRDFDEGDWGEAVGMATRLRVILNPGGKGKPSILQSLGAKKVPLLSTCEPIEDSDNVLEALGGLYRQRFAKDENGVSMS
jgi:predicted component of type VI protein secretion system